MKDKMIVAYLTDKQMDKVRDFYRRVDDPGFSITGVDIGIRSESGSVNSAILHREYAYRNVVFEFEPSYKTDQETRRTQSEFIDLLGDLMSESLRHSLNLDSLERDED